METLEQLYEYELEEATLQEVKEVLADQAFQIAKLKQLIIDQADTLQRHQAAMRKRKLEAGYQVTTSFDVVWSEVLAKSKGAK